MFAENSLAWPVSSIARRIASTTSGIVYTPQTLPASIVTEGIVDYGWTAAETIQLNDTWHALRIKQ